jgi:protein phosphatase 1L
MNIIRHPSFGIDTQRAIIEGFLKTDVDFCSQAKKIEDTSGTTATCVFIVGDNLYVANVGDSCAILCKGNEEPVHLTTEHKASVEEEKKRIKESGGLVVWFSGGWRVNGSLAVSRSIGDESLASVIIASPDCYQCKLTAEDEFIVMASDGLWDVMSEVQVVEYVHQWKKNNTNKDANISDALAEEAKRRNSPDNISIVVIFLQETGTGLRQDKNCGFMHHSHAKG